MRVAHVVEHCAVNAGKRMQVPSCTPLRSLVYRSTHFPVTEETAGSTPVRPVWFYKLGRDHGAVAQRLEHRPHTASVGGSIPPCAIGI